MRMNIFKKASLVFLFIFCFLPIVFFSCALLSSQNDLTYNLDFVYESPPYRIEKYSAIDYERSRLTSTESFLYRNHYMYIFKDGKIIEEGDIYNGIESNNIVKHAASIIYPSVLQQRKILTTDLYSVFLGDKITDYPDYFPFRFDKELNRAIFTTDTLNGWDYNFAYTDYTKTITEVDCTKTFKTQYAMHEFFIDLSNAIQKKYFPVEWSNIKMMRLQNRNSLSIADTPDSLKDGMIFITGVESESDFRWQFENYFFDQMRMGDEIKDLLKGFEYILSPTIYKIMALEDTKNLTVHYIVESHLNRKDFGKIDKKALEGF